MASVHKDCTPQKRLTKQQRQRLFLDSFSQNANVLLSAREAGISRRIVYEWLEHDETFSFAYNQAKEDANDMLRAEIYRRGMEGYTEQVVIGGKVQTVRKYSDTLLIFLSKARMPEFREKQQLEVTTNPDVSGFKELLLQRLARLEDNG